MNKYRISVKIGDGTYGEVYEGQVGSEKVAIKKMKRKFGSWEECMQLREVKALRRLQHPNIVKLREVVREGATSELFLIFEHMECNMYQLMKDRTRPFSERQIRSMIKQVLEGLEYMHKNGFFHRDCKPENFLVQGISSATGYANETDTQYQVKLADYGLAREIRSARNMTEYCSTRWYRAPEVLLKSTNYNSPVDLWAVGAIMAEIYMLRPLFPGTSESDQLAKTCGVLGTPTVPQWPDGHRLAAVHGIRFPQCASVPLAAVVKSASTDALKLMDALLVWDPLKRVGAASALCHPFFADDGGIRPLSGTRPGSGFKTAPAFPATSAAYMAVPIREFPSLDTLMDRRTSHPVGGFAPLRVKPLTGGALPKPSESGRAASSNGGQFPEPRRLWDTSLGGAVLPQKPKEVSAGSSALRSYFGNNARNFFL